MPGLRSFPEGDSRVGEDAADGRDRQLHIAGGLALQVEQPPVDHLLGPKRDVGGGLVGVGVERVDPAGAITRRQGDRAEFVMTRRRDARDVDPEPARAVAGGPAELLRVQVARPRPHSEDHGPAHRPSPTRPAPACLAGRARGRRRTSGRGRALGSRHPASRRSDVGQAFQPDERCLAGEARTGGDGPEEQTNQNGECDMTAQTWSLSSSRASAAATRPAAGLAPRSVAALCHNQCCPMSLHFIAARDPR